MSASSGGGRVITPLSSWYRSCGAHHFRKLDSTDIEVAYSRGIRLLGIIRGRLYGIDFGFLALASEAFLTEFEWGLVDVARLVLFVEADFSLTCHALSPQSQLRIKRFVAARDMVLISGVGGDCSGIRDGGGSR